MGRNTLLFLITATSFNLLVCEDATYRGEAIKAKNLTKIVRFSWSPQPGSNQRPTDYKSVALSAELWRRSVFW